MQIHGKDIRFRLTVGASAEVANLCPNNDLRRLGEVLDGTYAETVEKCAEFCEILNKWYVRSEKYEGRSADSLSEGEVMSLTTSEYKALMMEAMASFRADMTAEVEVQSKNVEQGAH